MINVTKTFLPPFEDYTKQVKRAYDLEWLTNRGVLVKELEDKISTYLDITSITITNNGTIPLQIALRLLADQGDVITTPFSYVATTAAILWDRCNPVFVDIHPEYLTIDETKIEAAITANTKVILVTHVFGNPCNVEEIERIAKKHNLKVIYDAAHCFGVKYNGKSLFKYGDVSTCSFHATKLFHTGEGGAMFTNDKVLEQKLFYSHNFGHNGAEKFHGLGINGKISELQAAMGLAVLPHMDTIIASRKKVCDFYDTNLTSNRLQNLKIRKGTEWNYSYYPVIFSTEQELLNVQKALNDSKIYPRRYFYPSLNKIDYVNDASSMPVSESLAPRILCLPLSADTDEKDLKIICEIINATLC